MAKYFKPASLTWWVSMAPLLSGVFIATEPLHGLEAYVLTIQNMFGGATAQTLILSGLGGIGLRGAL